MEFLFQEPGIRNGYVIANAEGHRVSIGVSEGYGAATKTHIVIFQGDPRIASYDTNHTRKLCLIAIAQFLKKRGAHSSLSYIDERGEAWGGKLLDVP